MIIASHRIASQSRFNQTTHFLPSFASLRFASFARRASPRPVPKPNLTPGRAPSTPPRAPSRAMTLVDALRDPSRPVFLFGASRAPPRRAARAPRRDSRRRRERAGIGDVRFGGRRATATRRLTPRRDARGDAGVTPPLEGSSRTPSRTPRRASCESRAGWRATGTSCTTFRRRSDARRTRDRFRFAGSTTRGRSPRRCERRAVGRRAWCTSAWRRRRARANFSRGSTRRRERRARIISSEARARVGSTRDRRFGARRRC